MKKLLYMLIGVLMLSACSSGVDTKDMSEIEQMLAAKDYEAAQSMCDDIVDDADLKAIDLQSLCKLSIYYVKLSDISIKKKIWPKQQVVIRLQRK